LRKAITQKKRKTPMPTYQYRCTTCGEDLEAVQKFTDAPLTVCPSCGGHLRKVFNAVGVVFKGSGFYRTDSRNGSKSGDSTDSGSSDKKSAAETKSTDKEPAGAGSGTSGNSSNGKHAVSSRMSSTGEKAATS
jgi:putative FmdB family regulatory protein